MKRNLAGEAQYYFIIFEMIKHLSKKLQKNISLFILA